MYKRQGTGRADGLGAEDRTKCAIAFCERVKELGYTAGVYASTTWYRKRVDYNTPVSYTHLLYCITIFLSHKEKQVYSNPLVSSRPVSYTHLDVYKRQGMIHGEAVFKMNTTTSCGWLQANPQKQRDL